MKNCTVSECFDKFLSNCLIESICLVFIVAVLSIIFKVQDHKHGTKTQGVMSGIVAAIWHLVLRSNLFYGNLYFHAIGHFSFWSDYCLFKQPFTGLLKHRTWSNY